MALPQEASQWRPPLAPRLGLREHAGPAAGCVPAWGQADAERVPDAAHPGPLGSLAQWPAPIAARTPDACRCRQDPVPSSWGGRGHRPAWYLAPIRPAGIGWHRRASAANAVASRLHSSHAHSRRSDTPPWLPPDSAAELAVSRPVGLPSPPQSSPLGACEPHVPVEPLHCFLPPLFYHIFTTIVVGTSQECGRDALQNHHKSIRSEYHAGN